MQKKYLKGGLSAVALAAIMSTSSGAFARTNDNGVSFKYRAPAGFPGDINRAHPFSVEPVLNDPTNPVALYGNAIIINTSANTGRNVLAGDTAITRIYGVAAREYPVQQTTGGMAATLGVGVPPTYQALSCMREGYVLVSCNGTPTKDGAVYLWIAASTGNHVQGTFETAATAGSTILVSNAKFNGPGDSAGVAELILWMS